MDYSIKNYCGTYTIQEWQSPTRNSGVTAYYIVSNEFHAKANTDHTIAKRVIRSFSGSSDNSVLFELVNIGCNDRQSSLEEIKSFCNTYGLLRSTCVAHDIRVEETGHLIIDRSKSGDWPEDSTRNSKAEFLDYMSLETFLRDKDYLEHLVRLECLLGSSNSEDVCELLNTIMYFVFYEKAKFKNNRTLLKELVHRYDASERHVAEVLCEILSDSRKVLPKPNHSSDGLLNKVVHWKKPDWYEDFLCLLTMLESKGLLTPEKMGDVNAGEIQIKDNELSRCGEIQINDLFFASKISCTPEELEIIRRNGYRVVCDELDAKLQKVQYSVAREVGKYVRTLKNASLFDLLLLELYELTVTNEPIRRCKRTDCRRYFSNVSKRPERLYCSQQCKVTQTQRDTRARKL